MKLSDHIADQLAELILPCLHRQYPNKIAHVLNSDEDAGTPAELTPAFYGCFDWHSAVHSHWSIATLLRLFPTRPWADRAQAALTQSLRADNIRAELEYLGPRRGFEMPYGIAWLLTLGRELALHSSRDWYANALPLIALGASRFGKWLATLSHPIRGGVHSQSAFAMGLALDHARGVGDEAMETLIAERAIDLYGADRDAPVSYEPSAYDFLSPSLSQADLLRRIMATAEFSPWLARFLPSVALAPVVPVDRADGKLVHFDGLNLSRAWMLSGIASALDEDDNRKAELTSLANAHGQAGLDGVLNTTHYAGSHWLGTFALYLLTQQHRL
jgi:hypothetical protein